jgi:acyl-coenzyme A thioesterase PaaI-like protein
MTGYIHEEISPEEEARERELYTPLTDGLRRLIDVAIRTRVPADEIQGVTKEIEELVARLSADAGEDSFGLRFTQDGRVRNYGNAVMGLRNAIAPPVIVQHDPENKRAFADFHLGAAYEGPPGMVHGGVSALLLDQVFGHAASLGGAPGMTGTLTIKYRRPTPLGDLYIEGRIANVSGIKTTVVGHIADAEGITVEAEGLFILPKWARELREERPDRFE